MSVTSFDTKSMALPLVSIIMPNYNCEKYLHKSVGSVLAQSMGNFELLICDDASKDGSLEILRELSSVDTRIKLLESEISNGPAIARSRSIEISTGRYLAFLDSDDFWETEKLELQIAHLASTEGAFSFTPYYVFEDGSEEISQVVDMSSPESAGYSELLDKRVTLGCSTVMLDATRVGRGALPNLPRGQDYAYWLQILRTTGVRAQKLRTPLTHYRIRPGSVSRNKWQKTKAQWSIYRDHEQLGRVRSLRHMAFYAKNAVFRQ